MKKALLLIAAMFFFCSGNILGASTVGVPIALLGDLISFIVVVIPAYLLTVMASNSFNFFNKKESVETFGNLAMGFAFCGFIIGMVFTLAFMGQPTPPGVDPAAQLASSMAVALIAMLYGTLVKYVLCPILINFKKNLNTLS
tara:strand:+ start:1093 stop:1518 length:426 start_codon:yes stop_codon:yes gene_type:complete